MDKKPLMLTLKHTDRAWAGYMRKIALEAGIPDSYRPIIMFLARNGEASQKELAAYAQTTYAAVSRTVKEMQLNGYLNKETDGADRRYAKLTLTPKGFSCADKIHDKIHNADRLITQSVGADKEREIVETLRQITELIKNFD